MAEDGANVLPGPVRRRFYHIVGDMLKEPMLLMLLAGAATYLIFGEPFEQSFLPSSPLFRSSSPSPRGARTERILDRLRDIAGPRALVIRDGSRQRIPGREVVRGDLFVLSEGDRVPADAPIISAEALRAGESPLTGESVPVHKIAAEADRPPTDRAAKFSPGSVPAG